MQKCYNLKIFQDKKKKKLGFHQGKPSRSWERETLSRESPTTANVVTVLQILPIQWSCHLSKTKKRSSRARFFLLYPVTLSFLLFLINCRIKNVFILRFMCIILFLSMTITTAATSPDSFTTCERKLKMVFGTEKEILRAYTGIYCCHLKYQNTCRF